MSSPTGTVSRQSAHAHPSTKKTWTAEQQPLNELFADINIDVHLNGLQGEHRTKVTDAYCPQVRRSPLTDEQHVNHLDVVSCWKGPSVSQAGEVAMWEMAFNSSLETQVLSYVHRMFASYLRNTHVHYNAADPTSVMQRLTHRLSAQNVWHISIDSTRLVHEMIDIFYLDNHGYKWFTSSRELPSMVYNFIRTRDCFLDNGHYPVLELNFDHERLGSQLSIFGNVQWHPPNISFPGLPSKLAPGSEYRIIPHYQEQHLGNDSGPQFRRFTEVPVFSVTSDTLPLAWDLNRLCFRAIVPDSRARVWKMRRRSNERKSLTGKARPPYTVETAFSAKIVIPFPGNVQFEQTTRYSIKLDIKPPFRSGRIDPHASLSVEIPHDDTNVYSSPPQMRSLEDNDFKAGLSASPWVPSYTHTPLSKCPNQSTEVFVHVDLPAESSTPSPDTSSVERGKKPNSRPRLPSSWSFVGSVDELRNSPKENSQKHSLDKNPHEPPTAPKELYPIASKDKNLKAHRPNPNKSKSHSRPLPLGSPTTSRNPGDRVLQICVTNQDGNKSPTNAHKNPEPSSGNGRTLSSTKSTPPQHKETRENRKLDPSVDGFTEKTRSRLTTLADTDFHRARGSSAYMALKEAVQNELKNAEHGLCTWLPESTGSQRNDYEAMIPQKRKAAKQLPPGPSYTTSVSFNVANLALDKLEHMDLEISSKRQKLGPRRDSGASMSSLDQPEVDKMKDVADEDVSWLHYTLTGGLGEASGTASPSTNTHSWFRGGREDNDPASPSLASKSRAYEAKDGSLRIMNSLKKKGSIKRMIFARRGAKADIDHGTPAPQNSAATYSTNSSDEYIFPRRSDCHPGSETDPLGHPACKPVTMTLDQNEIRKNFEQFLDQKAVDHVLRSMAEPDEEERKAYERAFLSDSGVSDWNTEDEDLSGELEAMSLEDGNM